ncbi:hypothetical protein MKK84_24645 [Methylobacterium sp. E-065]|uniref:DUF6894 family protein n=1 Tax=Methylobacterium sp. E-065 TaxID=2836583 RepID=UPI001FBB5803|nr:hypothetical protein [Methylobacterium sp. E-065]MCJ2020578.1 hypothetical protein [Methylobacterium sp. E-065]
MPRYFFSVHDDRSEIDTEGKELTGHAAARLVATNMASEILREEAYHSKHGEAWYLEVADEAGKIVCHVDVSVTTPSAGD